MKGCFLTVFCLMGFAIGCKAKPCGKEWVSLNCNTHRSKKITTCGDEKELKNKLQVIIKHERGPNAASASDQLQFRVDENCPKQFNQTAFRETRITIDCSYPDEDKSSVKIFCKENNSICKNIQSITSSNKSDETFIVSETNNGFSVSIRNVSWRHDGVYWCGGTVKTHYGALLKKIKLEVKNLTNFKRSPTIGQNFTFWCRPKYNEDFSKSTKFICKGEDPSICERLVSTTNPDKNQRFHMKEDNKRNITVTVREVTAGDTGMYWCGAERADKHPTFFNRFFMNASDLGAVKLIIVGALVLILLLLTAFVVIYKRSTLLKAGARESEQHPKEDYLYEEIRGGARTPESVTTIYATAGRPRDNPAALHYATINFTGGPDDSAAGASVVLKPSSSACVYSALSCSSAAVNQPSAAAGECLYASVRKPQRM
ncbi:uncharacterized protein LOC133449336 isoform X2 [Cololabis saira]|uniref:uncharacterized protein LOC133449336 isoform X2 n=1 Tax=Cololabis saira TaxID=129043 RepID=UPI002AD42613|nr:uncharacterized protein LOC133449336 isoform X2 [Cololabis saira]